MRRIWNKLIGAVLGGLMLALTPAALPQAPKPAAPMPAPAPMPRAATAPAPKPASNMPNAGPQPRVVIVEPVRVFDPSFDYPYLYTYPPDYMAQNFGYVKIDTKIKDASVFVDGGFADKVKKAKQFALRPGNHDIQLRDPDGRTIFQEKVAVTVGHTTTLHIG